MPVTNCTPSCRVRQYNELAFMYGDCDNYGDVNVDVKSIFLKCALNNQNNQLSECQSLSGLLYP